MSDKIQKSDFISLRVFFPLWNGPIGKSDQWEYPEVWWWVERDQIVAMMTSLTDLSKKSHTKEDLPQSEKNIFFFDFLWF